MEQKNLAPRDLIPFIGSRNRVYEMLAQAAAHARHDPPPA
jgi:hypothetical protein